MSRDNLLEQAEKVINDLGSTRSMLEIYYEDEVCYCNSIYCTLRGRIKGFNSSVTTILCQVGSYRTVVG